MARSEREAPQPPWPLPSPSGREGVLTGRLHPSFLSTSSQCCTYLARLQVLKTDFKLMAVRCYHVNAAVFTGRPRKKQAILHFG